MSELSEYLLHTMDEREIFAYFFLYGTIYAERKKDAFTQCSCI